ncbi:MAG: hypothetical protein ACI9SB_000961 [Candidatus Azotimanducaceae bacterium]|jgi:hypothetical protein
MTTPADTILCWRRILVRRMPKTSSSSASCHVDPIMAFFISTNDSVVNFAVIDARPLFTDFSRAQWPKFSLYFERLLPEVLRRWVT